MSIGGEKENQNQTITIVKNVVTFCLQMMLQMISLTKISVTEKKRSFAFGLEMNMKEITENARLNV